MSRGQGREGVQDKEETRGRLGKEMSFTNWRELPLVFVGRGVAKAAAPEDQRAEDQAADAHTHANANPALAPAGGQALAGGTVRTSSCARVNADSMLSGWRMMYVSAE